MNVCHVFRSNYTETIIRKESVINRHECPVATCQYPRSSVFLVAMPALPLTSRGCHESMSHMWRHHKAFTQVMLDCAFVADSRLSGEEYRSSASLSQGASPLRRRCGWKRRRGMLVLSSVWGRLEEKERLQQKHLCCILSRILSVLKTKVTVNLLWRVRSLTDTSTWVIHFPKKGHEGNYKLLRFMKDLT